MELKLPTNQRDQGMLAVCFLAVAAVAVYYMYVWSPKAEALTLMRTRVDSIVAQNESAQREIARGTATRLREEAEEYGRMLVLMRQLVPTANEVPNLIDQISTAARRTGLELAEVRPLGVIPGDIFDTHKFQMGVTGSYHRIAEFLANVGSLTRIIAPMNLTLRPTTRDINRQVSRPGEELLDARFEVQTYVAKTAAPAATGR